jgi:hypothetical protein
MVPRLTLRTEIRRLQPNLVETKEEAVLIHHSEVIDKEVVESLNRLADASKQMVTVPRNERR